MNPEITEWVTAGLKALGLVDRRLDPKTGKAVYKSAHSRFVLGNPPSWWMELKLPSVRWDASETSLTDLVANPDAIGWLIPETEEEVSPVYRLSAREAWELTFKCPFFEYYFLNEDISEIVIETEHDRFIVCRYVGS